MIKMDNLTLITIIGSAAFGAVAGKLLEAFVLTPITDRYERKKWLRQTKMEAFTKLNEEILSLGRKSQVLDGPLPFRALCASAILLIDDQELVAEIINLIEQIYKMSYDPSLIASLDAPENFSIKLSGGEKAAKKDVERGAAMEVIGKEALKISKKLGNNLRKT
jgi:hypothetical protein